MGGLDLAAQFERRVDEHPDREFLILGERRLTYEQVHAEAEALSAALSSLGVGPGDCIAVDLPNWPEWVVTLLATARIGAVLVPVNPSLSYHELKYQLRHGEVSICFVPQHYDELDYAELFDDMAEELPDLRQVITVGSEDQWSGGVVVSYGELLSRGKRAAETVVSADLNPAEAPLAIIYTPGTQGKPKGVVLTHENLLWTAVETSQSLGLTAEDRVFGGVPLSTVFGVHMVISTIMAGGTIVLQARFNPASALEIIEQESLTVVHGVPTMFQLIMRVSSFPDRDLSNVRTGIVAGSPVSADLVRSIRSWNDVQIAYGLTETGPTVAITRFEDPAFQRETTVGRVLDGVDVKIVDEQSARAEDGSPVGQLAVRGPNVMKGYYRMPQETKKSFTSDGYFLTGDLGSIGPGGFLTIVGRSDEMIIRGGYNIFPREIEDVSRLHPAVDHVCVVGVPNEILGEMICACVVPVEGAIVTGEEIREFVGEHLTAYKIPDVIRFVDELPLNDDGTVDRKELKKTMEMETSKK